MPRPARKKPGVSSRPPVYEIRHSPIHGTGMFAARPLRKGQRVCEYIGEKISKEESERRGLALMEEAGRSGGAAVYIFTLDEEWDLDGGTPENDARLINHSCSPNCDAWDYDGRLFIEARHAIKAGEELSFNYGFDIETWEDHPCRCGAPNCVGYILAEEHWPELRRRLAKREAAQRRAAAKKTRAAPTKKKRAPKKSSGKKPRSGTAPA